MFTAALFIIPKTGNKPNTNQQMKRKTNCSLSIQ